MKRIIKRLLSLTCAAALVASLAACGAFSSNSESTAGSEVTGQILSIDGTSVTLQLGTLTENEAPQGAPPDKPDDTSSGSTSDNAQTPPEKPEGDNSSSADQNPARKTGR